LRGTEGVMGIKPWEIGAGGLLVREAGGRATSTDGDEESLSTGTIVVSNGLLHEQILHVLREADAGPLPQQQSHMHRPSPYAP
jgi:3'-phosphoadenosine 5'-phosphosulfate (PAPS) 3'-phosphatase